VSLTRDKKVTQRIHQLNQILLAEKFVAENPLHLSPEIMDEDVGLAGLRAPGENRRREDCRHPPGSPRKVPPGPVDENDVPRNLVNVVGQIVDGELAFGEQEVLNGPAVGLGVGAGLGEKFGEVGDFGGELDVVGFDAGVGLLELGDGVFVLVEEDGAPLVVECSPEEGLVGETEDEEVGARREEEGFGEGGELRGGHGLGRDVGGGGVMEERFGDGGRESGEGGGRG